MKRFNILKILTVVFVLQGYIFPLQGIKTSSDNAISNPQLFDYVTKIYTMQTTLKKEHPENTHITIEDPNFSSFVFCIVENSSKKETELSSGLLKCYKQLRDGNNTFSIEDVLDALPSLLTELQEIEAKAPRPSISNAVVGEGVCDLAAIDALLYAILTKLSLCCNTNTADFNGTFSALFDLKNTLTTCCSDVFSDFQQTWTILSAGFNGTFSLVNKVIIDLTNCCNAVIAGLSVVETDLDVSNVDASNIRNTVVSTLTVATSTEASFASLLALIIVCCNNVNDINSLANCASCILACYNEVCEAEC